MNKFFRKINVVLIFAMTVTFVSGCQQTSETKETNEINKTEETKETYTIKNTAPAETIDVIELLDKVEVEAKVEISSEQEQKEERIQIEEVSVNRTLDNFVKALEAQKALPKFATDKQIKSKADPVPRYKDEVLVFQFLKLDRYREVDVDKVNEYLEGKGVLSGKGQLFIDAAKKNNVDPIYLIAHAVLETGNGTSQLANGIIVKGQKTYNLWGINAFDATAKASGSSKASKEGWTSIKDSIAGGTAWISKNYIHSKKFKQITIYQMKYNYVKGHEWHGYATDISWPDKISKFMYEMLDCYSTTETLEFEKVNFK